MIREQLKRIEPLRRLVFRVRDAERWLTEAIMRVSVPRRIPRRLLNRVYLRLGLRQASWLLEYGRDAFTAPLPDEAERTWVVRFEDRQITVPLRARTIALDWELALSVTGHDPEVKRMYAALRSHQEIDLFVDIGANHGTHSILFLTAGVETLAFEPNLACFSFFDALVSANHVPLPVEPCALGAEEGVVRLRYPEGRTWHGSTDAAWPVEKDVRYVELDVQQRVLDDYADRFEGKRAPLVKIDTEGGELSVLRGGRKVLEVFEPFVIFESLPSSVDRGAIFDELSDVGLDVFELPFKGRRSLRSITRGGFLDFPGRNFLAIPRSRLSTAGG